MNKQQREQLYRIERTLAERLRSAPKNARPSVAREAYSELYREISWHPDLTRSPDERKHLATSLSLSYERWVGRARVVLEIGAGGCDVLRAFSTKYPQVTFVATDVAREPVKSGGLPQGRNLFFVQSGVARIPLPDETVDFAFCSQVLEHFHPDDVPGYLAEIRRVLKPAGWFGLDTPNRITGPHDISQYFTAQATGLHLKEWTFSELYRMLALAGFDRILTRALPGRLVQQLRLPPPGPLMPVGPKSSVERCLMGIPHRGLRRMLGHAAGLNGIYLYARKGRP